MSDDWGEGDLILGAVEAAQWLNKYFDKFFDFRGNPSKGRPDEDASYPVSEEKQQYFWMAINRLACITAPGKGKGKAKGPPIFSHADEFEGTMTPFVWGLRGSCVLSHCISGAGRAGRRGGPRDAGGLRGPGPRARLTCYVRRALLSAGVRPPPTTLNAEAPSQNETAGHPRKQVEPREPTRNSNATLLGRRAALLSRRFQS